MIGAFDSIKVAKHGLLLSNRKETKGQIKRYIKTVGSCCS